MRFRNGKAIYYPLEKSNEDKRKDRMRMKNQRGQIMFLPNLSLKSLDGVHYLDLVPWCLAFNKLKPDLVYSLWAGVVLNIFFFETEERQQKALVEVRYLRRSSRQVTISDVSNRRIPRKPSGFGGVAARISNRKAAI